MTNTATTKTLAGLLLMAGLAGLGAVPPAAAHDCVSLLPTDCGPCGTGSHSHYVGAAGQTVLWCSSSTPSIGRCLEDIRNCLGESAAGFRLDAAAAP